MSLKSISPSIHHLINSFLAKELYNSKSFIQAQLEAILRFRIISVAILKSDIVTAENTAAAPQTLISFL